MIMRIVALAVLLAGVLAAAACHQAQKITPLPPGPQTVTSGSTLQVLEPFVIPQGQSRIYFQDAQIGSANTLRPNFPYCQFEMPSPATAARTIQPQVYTIGSVEYDEQNEVPGGKFASVTYLNLQRDARRTEERLACLLPGDARASRFVTPAEINGAPGGYFNLTVAQ